MDATGIFNTYTPQSIIIIWLQTNHPTLRKRVENVPPPYLTSSVEAPIPPPLSCIYLLIDYCNLHIQLKERAPVHLGNSLIYIKNNKAAKNEP